MAEQVPLDAEDDEALCEFRLQQKVAAGSDKGDGRSSESSQSHSEISGSSDSVPATLDEIVEVVDVDEDTGIFLANPENFSDDAFGSLFGKGGGFGQNKERKERERGERERERRR